MEESLHFLFPVTSNSIGRSDLVFLFVAIIFLQIWHLIRTTLKPLPHLNCGLLNSVFFWAEPCSFWDPSLPTRDQTQAQGNESAKFQSLDHHWTPWHQSYFYILSFFSFYKEYNLLYSKFGKQMSSSLSPILIQGQQITSAYTYRLGHQGS